MAATSEEGPEAGAAAATGSPGKEEEEEVVVKTKLTRVSVMHTYKICNFRFE